MRRKQMNEWCARTRTLIFGMMVVIGVFGGGCVERTATTRPSNMADRMTADPWADPSMEKPDISGGGLMEFDKKAFNRDVDHVFNP